MRSVVQIEMLNPPWTQVIGNGIVLPLTKPNAVQLPITFFFFRALVMPLFYLLVLAVITLELGIEFRVSHIPVCFSKWATEATQANILMASTPSRKVSYIGRKWGRRQQWGRTRPLAPHSTIKLHSSSTSHRVCTHSLVSYSAPWRFPSVLHLSRVSNTCDQEDNRPPCLLATSLQPTNNLIRQGLCILRLRVFILLNVVEAPYSHRLKNLET